MYRSAVHSSSCPDTLVSVRKVLLVHLGLGKSWDWRLLSYSMSVEDIICDKIESLFRYTL